MNAFMSSGLDEKQPATLIVSSNKIAAVETFLRIFLTFLSLCGARSPVYVPFFTLGLIIGI
jgi:hypothetical protein